MATLDELANKLALALSSQIPIEVALWDYEMVAKFLHRSVESVRNRISIRPDFPRAIRIGEHGKSGLPRPLFKAKEIIAWADSFQDKN